MIIRNALSMIILILMLIISSVLVMIMMIIILIIMMLIILIMILIIRVESGSPQPTLEWKREGEDKALESHGGVLTISKVTRHMVSVDVLTIEKELNLSQN